MANTLTASLREEWSRDYQDQAEKVNVYSNIANYRLESLLTKGVQAHRPYMSDVTINTLGSEGSYTRQDITSTDEYLTVDVEKEASFYVKDIDNWQSHYSTREFMAKRCGVKLMNKVDGDVLGEYASATYSVSDGDFGGTTGNGITLTTSNIAQIFTKASRKLGVADNDSSEEKTAVISEQFYEVLMDKLEGRETALGDQVAQNGKVGKYMGWNLVKSNALTTTARLEFATLPTDGDTVVINGVTFTFKDSIGTTAGYVHIGASTAAVALANLVASINAPGTTVAEGAAAGFVALSAANQAKMKNIVATDGSTYLTIKAEGQGSVAVSETLTAAADVWTATKQVQHNLFVQGKPIDLVLQKAPKMMLKDRDGYIGNDVVNYLVYGVKTFADGARRMVDVAVASSAF
jgi:hypothetical protein